MTQPVRPEDQDGAREDDQCVPDPAVAAPRTTWVGDAMSDGSRVVPRETPVALTYNRATHAVMLATPADLEDFAIGFSLSENIIKAVDEVGSLEIVAVPNGIECRMDLAADRLEALTRRQRRLAGASGCGLCGLESLSAALRPAPAVPAGRAFTPAMIRRAIQSLPSQQQLNAVTHAVHAAAFWTPERGLVALREDVGRHNALDKLAGALARAAVSAADGVVLLSSRVSVEMVQKAATMGVPVIVAVSAPTSLAIEVAIEAGMTLIAVARADGFEVFSHTGRVTAGAVV